MFCVELLSGIAYTNMLHRGTSFRAGNFRKENLLCSVAAFLLGAETKGTLSLLHLQQTSLTLFLSQMLPTLTLYCKDTL